MPSSFLKKAVAVERNKTKGRYYTYDRTIVCLPTDCCASNVIRIPRNRQSLYEDGLIGKIRLTSEMSEDDIFAEIHSVFRVPMAGNDGFLFDVLQSTGVFWTRFSTHTKP